MDDGTADASVLFTDCSIIPPDNPASDINGDEVVDAANEPAALTNWIGDSLAAVPELATAAMLTTCVFSLLAARGALKRLSVKSSTHRNA